MLDQRLAVEKESGEGVKLNLNKVFVECLSVRRKEFNLFEKKDCVFCDTIYLLPVCTIMALPE